ncbi:MAG TPA: hypothetical protein GXX36_05990 [Clostridiaceae bacterium]|nr:hypothetical protein [Clostridiaceae bacterium]
MNIIDANFFRFIGLKRGSASKERDSIAEESGALIKEKGSVTNDRRSATEKRASETNIRHSEIKERSSLLNERGSVTVEAAIALPIFICLIVSVVFLVKVVYVHEMIQHAIDETANQIADLGYIFYVSGAGEIHDSIRDGLDSKAELFKRHSDDIIDALDDLDNIEKADEAVDTITDVAEEILENPLEELKSIGSYIAGGAFNDIKTQLILPLVKQNIKKYLNAEKTADIDNKLLGLNIENGFDGLDFSKSNFFKNQNNDIEIVVKYRMSLALPVKLLPDITIVQRACARAWTMGSGTSNKEDASDNEEDIWSLDNFSRGKKLREIFGANLPFNFPVIASFKDGVATMIKSMDLTASTYQTAGVVREKLYSYIDELADFQGQENPWGRDRIVIKNDDIKQKQLVLIIPGNTIQAEVEEELHRCINYANSRGIIMTIEKYGMKKID